MRAVSRVPALRSGVRLPASAEQNVAMNAQPLSDADLALIEQRAATALDVAPAPWNPWLETRHGIGGCSFIQFGADPNTDNELYLDLRLGPEQIWSPGERLDAVVDFLGSAAEDIPRLVAEVRRLRQQPLD
jgi:hypothetical protein